MLKKNLLFSLVLGLAMIAVIAGTPLPEAAEAGFADIQEALWAQQAVAEMSACEIIAGYPDGYFRPYQSITRLEAVTMLVRVLGLGEQAKAKEKAIVDYKMPSDLLWGRGYLIMGVELGMLDKDYLDVLQPAYPATRAEVATLVYHALKLNPGDATLTFADTDQIPRDYRECVAAMVENNIMQGLPGNVFKPNDQINRAQMAVLLSRLVDNNFADPCSVRRFKGTISSIDLTNRLITLQLGIYGYLNLNLDSGCEVFIDDKRMEPADLRVGDDIKLIIDKNGRVVFINAAQASVVPVPVQVQVYKGRLDSLFTIGGEYWLALNDFNSTKITRPVAEDAKCTRFGSQREISSLAVGEYVEIKVADNKITEIEFLDTEIVEGTVSSVNRSSLTVWKSNDEKTKLEVPDNIVVMKDGSAKTYDDVKVDSRVEVTVYDNKAVKIDILSYGDIEGEIRSLITTDTYSITILDYDGYRMEYTVDSDVRVRRDGYRIDFEDLRKGEWVRLEMDGRDRVVYIEAINEDRFSDLEGEIRSLVTTDTYSITILDYDGYRMEYTVDSDVRVRRDGYRIDFEDLRRGEWVRLELDGRDRVTYIEVTDEESSLVAGTVTRLNTGRIPEIRLKKSDGREIDYDIMSGATFTRDGDRIYLDDIVVGCEVKVRLEDGEVESIEVTNDEDIIVKGEVTRVAARNRIIIEQVNGHEFSYYLADNSRLKDWYGNSITFEDVREGWDVELELRNGKIYRLTRM